MAHVSRSGFALLNNERGNNTALFVNWDEDRAQRRVSKRWVSSALSEAIRVAYACMGRADEIFSANPHSDRGAS